MKTDCGKINGDYALEMINFGLNYRADGTFGENVLEAQINGTDYEFQISRLFNDSGYYLTTYVIKNGIRKYFGKFSGHVKKYYQENGKFVIQVGFRKLIFGMDFPMPDDKDYSSLDAEMFLQILEYIYKSKLNRCLDNDEKWQASVYGEILVKLKDIGHLDKLKPHIYRSDKD